MKVICVQVSVSLQVGVGPGDDLNLWVRHSGENLEETRVHGVSDQMNFGTKTDNTGRMIVLDLKIGDNVSLFTDHTQSTFGIVPFCVSSIRI